MKVGLRSAVAGLAGLLLAPGLVLAQAPAGNARQVTFSKDVAPIFQAKCQDCHRPGAMGPMSLVSYQDARPWARSIKNKVASREMPPFHIDRTVGIQQFKNNPSLSAAEIDTIVKWVDAGAPQGNPADMPPARQFGDPNAWTIGTPDAVFTMTEPFHIPANGAVDYQYIRIPVNLPDDRWIKAIEIKPGARAQVHHVIAYSQPHGQAWIMISTILVLGMSPGNH